jgi:hypothetical protein
MYIVTGMNKTWPAVYMAVGEIIIADTMTTQGSYVLQEVSLRKIKYIVHHKYMSVSFLDV